MRWLCPIFEKFTFLHFRVLICVKRVCGLCDIRGDIYSSMTIYDDISHNARNSSLYFRSIIIDQYGI